MNKEKITEARYILEATELNESEIQNSVEIIEDVLNAQIDFLRKYEPHATNTIERLKIALHEISSLYFLDDETEYYKKEGE